MDFTSETDESTTFAPGLKALQSHFVRQIYSAKPPESTTAELYRELTHFVLQESMDSVYRYTRQVYQSTPRKYTWEQLCTEFILNQPPQDFRINWAVTGVGDWLHIETSLKELASYEWMRFESLSAPDPTPEDWLNPSLMLRSFTHSVPQWYLDLETGKNAVRAQETWVAVFRDLHSYHLKTLQLQPAAFDLLSQWKNGSTPETSAQEIAAQLGRNPDEILSQFGPLLKLFKESGILLNFNC